MGEGDRPAAVLGGDATYWYNAFKTLQKIHADDLARIYRKTPANEGADGSNVASEGGRADG